MKTSDLTRQNAKELACKAAISLGFGLIRRGEEIWKVYPNGRVEFLLTSSSDVMWHAALEYLTAILERRPVLSSRQRWIWSVVHNTLIHPVMPFTWGRPGRVLGILHDWTARKAFGDVHEP